MTYNLFIQYQIQISPYKIDLNSADVVYKERRSTCIALFLSFIAFPLYLFGR